MPDPVLLKQVLLHAQLRPSVPFTQRQEPTVTPTPTPTPVLLAHVAMQLKLLLLLLSAARAHCTVQLIGAGLVPWPIEEML